MKLVSKVWHKAVDPPDHAPTTLRTYISDVDIEQLVVLLDDAEVERIAQRVVVLLRETATTSHTPQTHPE